MPVSVSLPRAVARSARAALRSQAVTRAVLRAAAVRGQALVLLYHRVAPEGPSSHQVVRVLGVDVFRRQLEALCEVGDVVALRDLTEPSAGRRRVRIGLSFDDDYASHCETVLPVLAELGLPATFFLGGRSLHGLGGYWWEALEERIRRDGLAGTAESLGLLARSPQQLAAACETSAVSDRLAQEAVRLPVNHISVAQLRTLADTPGVTVGFHTLHHPVLPALDDIGLRRALHAGRRELEQHLGRRIALLAYPHGKADRRVADAARQAGFQLAWTGVAAPVRRGDDRLLLGRWEPNDLAADDFRTMLAIRLSRAAPRR